MLPYNIASFSIFHLICICWYKGIGIISAVDTGHVNMSSITQSIFLSLMSVFYRASNVKMHFNWSTHGFNCIKGKRETNCKALLGSIQQCLLALFPTEYSTSNEEYYKQLAL